MSVMVKICGLTDVAGIAAAVEAGADAIGFVFAESPRRIEPARAAALAADVPSNVRKVAVMRHPDQALLDSVFEAFDPDWLQTDAEDLGGLEIPGHVTQVPVFRDRPSFSADKVDCAGPVVFEGADSGVGMAVDSSVAAALARRIRTILAGGLNTGNVAEAIARVRPWGVDVSSGVESAPGRKDPDRIRSFVEAVRLQEIQDAN